MWLSGIPIKKLYRHVFKLEYFQKIINFNLKKIKILKDLIILIRFKLFQSLQSLRFLPKTN